MKWPKLQQCLKTSLKWKCCEWLQETNDCNRHEPRGNRSALKLGSIFPACPLLQYIPSRQHKARFISPNFDRCTVCVSCEICSVNQWRGFVDLEFASGVALRTEVKVQVIWTVSTCTQILSSLQWFMLVYDNVTRISALQCRTDV